jgi:hypothetical protein
MADDGAVGGTGRGEELSASIGERLEAKERLGREAAEERRAGEVVQERTERKKADEREAVAAHLAATGASAPGWRAARDAARAGGRAEARRRDWTGRGLPAVGVALAAVGLLTGRRAYLVVALPLLAGVVALRRRAPLR